MNITLSADKELIDKGRQYAKEHNTTLNNLIRNYLNSICGQDDINSIAEEFAEMAKTRGGKSSSGFKFHRDQLYDRNR